MTLENCVYRGQGGNIISREIRLKASVMTTIRETLNWVCSNLNEERGVGGGGYVSN